MQELQSRLHTKELEVRRLELELENYRQQQQAAPPKEMSPEVSEYGLTEASIPHTNPVLQSLTFPHTQPFRASGFSSNITPDTATRTHPPFLPSLQYGRRGPGLNSNLSQLAPWTSATIPPTGPTISTTDSQKIVTGSNDYSKAVTVDDDIVSATPPPPQTAEGSYHVTTSLIIQSLPKHSLLMKRLTLSLRPKSGREFLNNWGQRRQLRMNIRRKMR